MLAGVFLREGFPRLLFAGCVISFAGVAVIGFAGAKPHVDAGWGVVLCLIAAVGYGILTVAQVLGKILTPDELKLYRGEKAPPLPLPAAAVLAW